MMKTNLSEGKIWHLLTVTLAPEIAELVSSRLFDLGATGILTLEETESSLQLGAYFDHQAIPEAIARDLEAECARANVLASLFGVALTEVADQDWMQKWKEGFEPIHIGNKLIIAPSWKLPEDAAGRAVIQIDPGMAFGTGTHETTRLCLEALEARLAGGSLLDVGTGTGILAIAAALLAKQTRIVAIDIDPLAIEVAKENLEINRVEDRIEIAVGEAADFAGQDFDMVVANLTAEVIIALMDDLSGCLNPTGSMILSGILTTLRPLVEQSLAEAGLQVVERREAGEWSMMVAQRGEA